MATYSEASENQAAVPDVALENAEPTAPIAEPAPPAEQPSAKSAENLPEKPDNESAIAETKERKSANFAPETKPETAETSETSGSETASETGKTTEGDAASKEMPDTEVPELIEKDLKKARRKAQRKGFFENPDEEISVPEMSEWEEETEYGDSNVLTPRYSDRGEKHDLESVLSYSALGDDDIETILKTDRADEDELDSKVGPQVNIKDDTVQMKNMFLDLFEMPSLSDISDEHEPKVKTPRTSKRKTKSESIDPGQVVAPMKSKSSLATSDQESTESSDSSNSSDGLDNLPLSNVGSTINVVDPRKTDFEDEDVFTMFKKSIATGEIDADEVARIRQMQMVISITMDFLMELLEKVVTQTEEKKTHEQLKGKLNVEGMMYTLKEEVQGYISEKEMNVFLNGRMIDYYKRLKNFRQIKELPNNLILLEYQRYMDALICLDRVLETTKETKRKVSFLMSSVLMDLTYVQNIMMDTEEHFENIVLHTIGKRTDYLFKVAERELRLIDKKRCEISDERLSLITRKHTLARITQVSFDMLLTIYLLSLTLPSLPISLENRQTTKDR